MLTDEQLEELASRKGVRRIAIENFLTSLGGMSKSDAIANMKMDAKLYKWNGATQRALREGITKYFK